MAAQCFSDGDRSDVDDRGARPLEKVRDRELAQAKGRSNGEMKRGLQLLDGRIEERRPFIATARVVHHDVEPTEFVNSTVDQAGQLLVVGDVNCVRKCSTPVR